MAVPNTEESPLKTSGFFSRLFFCWLGDIFSKGYRRRLEPEDMYKVLEEDTALQVSQKLDREWRQELECRNGKPSLTRAIARCFKSSILQHSLIISIEEIAKVVQPVFLGQLLSFFDVTSGIPVAHAYFYAVGVCACAVLQALTHHPAFFLAYRMGMRTRVGCSSLIYRKVLRLGSEGLGQSSTGQIVNMLSNDVQRFDQAFIFPDFLWIGPLQTVAILSLLWHEMGPSCLAGLLFVLLTIPIQSYLGKRLSTLRSEIALKTDKRVNLMHEVISGIRAVKLYTWEELFTHQIQDIRGNEVKDIKTSSAYRAFNAALFYCSAKIIMFFTFLTFSLIGGGITSRTVFVAVSYFDVLRLSLTWYIPLAVQFGSEAFASAKRIQEFLLLEVDDPVLTVTSPVSDPCEGYITLQNVSAAWKKTATNKGSEDKQSLTKSFLRDVTLSIQQGQLVAVVGPVGGGKASLLKVISGELPIVTGKVRRLGSLAFSSKEPWIFPGTVRDNIVFGSEFHPERYRKVIASCGLAKDVRRLSEGDLTLVGDKGATLSGGQKTRINLARAAYQKADIYLLNDPFSAVDTIVGQHIFSECIRGVLAEKTRVIITHQLQHVKAADLIIVMKEGQVSAVGSYEDLQAAEVDLLSAKPGEEEEKAATSQTPGRNNDMGLFTAFKESEFSDKKEKEEDRKAGSVTLQVYLDYFRSGCGLIRGFFLILLIILPQVPYVLCDWWLSYWAETVQFSNNAIIYNTTSNTSSTYNTTTNSISAISVPTTSFLPIYVGLVGALSVLSVVRALLFFNVTVTSAEHLHNSMLMSILQAPMSFFDSNPVGRILNRFSKDIGIMDELLPQAFFDYLQLILVVTSALLVSAVVNPWVLIPTVPITAAFFLTRHYYLQTSRDVKRLEATARSPVFSHVSTTLSGLATLRVMKMQDSFLKQFHECLDHHSSGWFLFISCARWFQIRLDWLCAAFVATVAFGAVLALDSVSGGLVGLSLTQAIMLMGVFQWVVKQSAEVENQMTSVERVVSYTQLEKEPPRILHPRPPSDWPSRGRIQLNNVTMRYGKELPPALNNVSVSISPGEKIGIVGRTGAGKTSLIMSLFRLVESDGTTVIDGHVTTEVGLKDLRSRMTVIPQDPVLFKSSLRQNLDPFSEHSDTELWAALEEVQLKQVVEKLPEGLDTGLVEFGANFSLGQRQLLCLGRAILKKSRIVVLDEATANVDPQTDGLILRMIEEKFADCTVLTIAHRLHSIMDCDKVMVLQDGGIVEFDEPSVLLCQEGSVFRSMVGDSGRFNNTMTPVGD
ncbi:ATP-binding cassette sub-family C member 4-like [Branchiostoma floridae x Branchiostoma belcheri]